MKKLKCQFYFSFRSPYAWLTWKIMRDVFPSEIEIIPSWNPNHKTYTLLKEKGGDLLYVNMLKEKHLYIMHDIQRIARQLNFKLVFPTDSDNTNWETIHLCYLYAEENNKGRAFMDRVFSTRWESGLDIWNADNIRILLQKSGLDPSVIDDKSWKQYYQNIGVDKLYEGYMHGVFGVPFFIIGNSKFWGIERIIPLLRKWNSICDSDNIIKESMVKLPMVSHYNTLFDHAGGCG